ncbi:hypothetical protein EDB84DRAFT_291436 [Lactarius hengduanensis]|nr:hypothetical protein EDB84DRAFT_291436 [Lactarius hengduanensis]
MLLDPSSREYKRARRHHYKTTKNRDGDTDPDWTPFRAAEKKYKARFPPPDLSGALDLALLDASRHADIEQTGWKGRPDAVRVKEIGLDDARQKSGAAGTRRAFAVVDVPGLVILPAFVSDEAQRDLIRWSLRDHAKFPNETNLDTHYILPHSGLWSTYISSPETVVQPRLPSSATPPSSPGPRRLVSNTPASPATFSLITSTPKPSSLPSAYAQPISTAQLVPRLRWANIGWSYHWGTKQYNFAREVQPVGEQVRRVCLEVVRSIRWQEVFGGAATELLDGWEGASEWRTWQETYEPDAGIVNFYQIKDSLMGHVDRSEICATSPLVSISLGNAAIFLVGGLTRDVVPIPILLRSGDIVVMSGPACRRAYHGVPRILEGTLPTYLDEGDTVTGGTWTPYARYMHTARVNVNVRQVFPSGFDPRLAQA